MFAKRKTKLIRARSLRRAISYVVGAADPQPTHDTKLTPEMAKSAENKRERKTKPAATPDLVDGRSRDRNSAGTEERKPKKEMQEIIEATHSRQKLTQGP